MKKRCYFGWLLFVTFLFFLLPLAPYASKASQLRVVQGRTLLFNNGEPSLDGAIAANAKFQEAVNFDAGDQEAAVFLSVTRMVILMDDTASYTPGVPIENIRELLDILGVDQDGRDPFDWTATIPEDSDGDLILPQDMPTLGEIQNFIESVVLQEINAAIGDLSIVSTSFSTLITAGEIGDESGSHLELDYGDVVLYKSGLYALKTAFEILLSYNLDVNDFKGVISKLENELFDINDDLLDQNLEFLKLLSDGAATVTSAKTSLNNFIDSYIAASQFIHSETDDQSDDLFTFEAEDDEAEIEFRAELENIKLSLQNNMAVNIGDDESVMVNFSEFFNDPMNLRYYLPTIEYDPVTIELLDPDICTVFDTTFSGVFPNGLPDCNLDSGYMVTSNLSIRAVIETVDKGPIEGVWRLGGQDTTARGDQVIWGYFYASPSDVSWGSQNNPDVFVKIWIDVNGPVYVDYFHVSVPDIHVYTDFQFDGTVDQQGTATLTNRFVEHHLVDGTTGSTIQSEDGLPPSGYFATANPVGTGLINDLKIGAMINTVDKGPIEGVWRLGGQDTTSRGDQVVWGYFYADPNVMSWGSQDNPDLFVKIWFDVGGAVFVDFFHVSVPDIEVFSNLSSGAVYANSGVTILSNRFVEHRY